MATPGEAPGAGKPADKLPGWTRGGPIVRKAYARGPVWISIGWVGIIFMGAGSFYFAKTDLDKKRMEALKREGPRYRKRAPRNVPIEAIEAAKKESLYR